MGASAARHLEGCPECQAWQEALHSLTRRVRLSAARDAPDLTPRLLNAVIADRDERAHRSLSTTMARGGLLAAACAQLIIVIPALWGNAGPDVPAHASRELGAFNLALAIGFLAAAARPSRARVTLWVIAPATAMLIGLAVIDTLLGQTTLWIEAPHIIALIACALLAILARHGPPGARRTGAEWGAPVHPS